MVSSLHFLAHSTRRFTSSVSPVMPRSLPFLHRSAGQSVSFSTRRAVFAKRRSRLPDPAADSPCFSCRLPYVSDRVMISLFTRQRSLPPPYPPAKPPEAITRIQPQKQQASLVFSFSLQGLLNLGVIPRKSCLFYFTPLAVWRPIERAGSSLISPRQRKPVTSLCFERRA